MKRSHAKISMFLVLLTSVILLSTNTSAQTLPELYFAGNYNYSAGVLSFTNNSALGILYDNYEYVEDTDPIIGATLSFGTLTNSTSHPLVFSPSTFTVDGFFTATLDNFVVNDQSELSWGSLSNIVRVEGATSRYVDELLANGGGIGNIYMSFTPVSTPDDSGIERFTSNSNGAVSGVVAAPEPISAILFVTGGLTLGFRSYRKRRIQ
jgi:hypothetical protein